MLEIVTGQSDDPDTAAATRDALEMAAGQLNGASPKGAIAFAGIDTDPSEMIEQSRRCFRGIELAGCTTDGELNWPEGFLKDRSW